MNKLLIILSILNIIIGFIGIIFFDYQSVFIKEISEWIFIIEIIMGVIGISFEIIKEAKK